VYVIRTCTLDGDLDWLQILGMIENVDEFMEACPVPVYNSRTGRMAGSLAPLAGQKSQGAKSKTKWSSRGFSSVN